MKNSTRLILSTLGVAFNFSACILGILTNSWFIMVVGVAGIALSWPRIIQFAQVLDKQED